ncbi:MAG: hypothetical protein KDC67_07610, partial [Ignavibacteriae bacterium]|nr:hypothetical protein [Ignavibacteriota bacterium]
MRSQKKSLLTDLRKIMKTREDITKIIMYKTEWCSDCFRADNFFYEYNIKPERIDIDTNLEAAEKVIELNNGKRT